MHPEKYFYRGAVSFNRHSEMSGYNIPLYSLRLIGRTDIFR